MRASQFYRIPKGRAVSARIEGLHGDRSSVSAQLITLYPKRAELVTFSPVEQRAPVKLRLQHRPTLDLTIPGTVTCVLDSREGEWLLYCDFDREVSQETLDELVEAKFLTRCDPPGGRLPLEAALQWEADSTKAPVTLESLTTAGFCVVSSKAAAEGERLRLILEGPAGERTLIPATTEWHVEAGAGFRLGCAFESIEGYQHLRDFLSPAAPVPERATGGPQAGLTQIMQMGTVAFLYCNYLLLV